MHCAGYAKIIQEGTESVLQIKGQICLLYLGCVINLNYCYMSVIDD